jgi:hypothetical protein
LYLSWSWNIAAGAKSRFFTSIGAMRQSAIRA